MKKNHSCNALKVLKIIRIILSILLLSYTLSLCIIGHCASEQDYFPMLQNANGHFSEELKQNISNRFDSVNNYVLVYYDNYNPNSGYGRYYYNYIYFPKSSSGMLYGEKYNNLYQWSIYFIGNVSYTQGGFYCDRRTPNNIDGVTGSSNSAQWFQGLPSSNYNTNKDYVSNFTIYTNNNKDTRQIVLLYDDGISIPEGDTAREDMEKPNIDDYLPEWTNTPTFDNSSVENAIESVFNGITWLAENIKDTITGTAEYMADTVRWSIQKVLDTIRAIPQAINEKIQEVKNAILTMVDKIQATFDYISQPYDSTKINTAFNNMAIKSDYNNMTTLVNNAVSVFDSTSEPNTFRIPVHLENIPILHINEVQYIDLGWIYDSRSIIRAFMWCVTTFSLLYTIIDALPSYLQGNDE